MARWLWAALCLTLVRAWTPPAHPLLLDPKLHRVRHRRDISDQSTFPKDHTHTVNIHGWLVQLRENSAIRAPYDDECRFYKGQVVEENDSAVAITECQGQYYGLLQVNSKEFVLQPTTVPHDSHVLRRRDITLTDMPPVFNLTGDTVTDLELDFIEETTPYIGPRIKGKSEVEYFRSQSVPVYTRPVSGVRELWLEMAIVADNSVTKFHGKDRVNHYILALMNIVSAIFNDSSLDSNITLVISKVFIQEKESINKYDNIKKKLSAVNKWNYKHLNRLPSGTSGWDATIWLTRTPLGGPSGFAGVGGICTKSKSGALIHDEGLTSAFVIAHELGHLLGLNHDGNGQCDDLHQGYVMATTVFSTIHKYAWSSCSKKQFHEKSKSWWCMHERSTDEGVVLNAQDLTKYVFTMDEQCRTEFGEGFVVCKLEKLRQSCAVLYCANKANPAVCLSKSAPPLEGTRCGSHHWCIDRSCEPMPDNVAVTEMDANPRNRKPQWSEWSDWNGCDSNCGYGLRLRTRQCWRGDTVSEDCEGSKSEALSCWSGRECAAQRDIRTTFCRRHSINYIPYWPNEEAKYCEIWCVDYKGGEAVTLGSLPDGTPCSYDRPYDLCFQGTCLKGICNETDPVCNSCSEGYCKNNTFKIYSKLRNYPGWSRITMVPHNAQNLSIRIKTPVALKIAVKEKGKNKPIIDLTKHTTTKFDLQELDNSIGYDPNAPQNLQIIEIDSDKIRELEERNFGYEGKIVVAGIVLKCEQRPDEILLSTDSVVQSDLMILGERRHFNEVYNASYEVYDVNNFAVEVYMNYSTRNMNLEYGGYLEKGPCSVSCGGGHRLVKTRCSYDHRCHKISFEACNTHRCEFSWVPAEWEQCSQTCGDKGVQDRQIFCLPNNVRGRQTRSELIAVSVSPALCSPSRPQTQQACNRVPCPVYWEELSWTPCSATCGRGISRKPLTCPAEDVRLCGPKPIERKKRCRLRRCPQSRILTCENKDEKNYCEYFSLEETSRFCVLPDFRRNCCNLCRENDIYKMGYG